MTFQHDFGWTGLHSVRSCTYGVWCIQETTSVAVTECWSNFSTSVATLLLRKSTRFHDKKTL